MILIEITIIQGARRAVVALQRPSTDTIQEILREALLQAGLGDVAGTWTIAYQGRALALHEPLAQAIPGLGERATIALEVSLEREDRTVELDAGTDFDLESPGTSSEILSS